MGVNIFGGYRTMWLMVMFDLPTETTEDRRNYHHFHDFLLTDGFTMMQFSIYIRHCASEENALVHKQRIQASLPNGGEVRILTITDKQFERMSIFYGKIKRKPEKVPQQVSLF